MGVRSVAIPKNPRSKTLAERALLSSQFHRQPPSCFQVSSNTCLWNNRRCSLEGTAQSRNCAGSKRQLSANQFGRSRVFASSKSAGEMTNPRAWLLRCAQVWPGGAHPFPHCNRGLQPDSHSVNPKSALERFVTLRHFPGVTSLLGYGR